MTCSDFLARYSDFRDDTVSRSEREDFQVHLEECATCARYHRVVSRGVSLLRALPPQRLRDDFGERLRHSLYTLDEQRRLRGHRPQGGTGAGAMLVAAAAVLVLAVVLTPSLWEPAPTVELAPITAQAPRASFPAAYPASTFGTSGPERSSLVSEQELWQRSNALLFEHSSLYQRHRTPTLVRAGTQ